MSGGEFQNENGEGRDREKGKMKRSERFATPSGMHNAHPHGGNYRKRIAH
jgi:hypothetical protein